MSYTGILHLREDLRSELVVDQEPAHVEPRCARCLKQSEDGIADQILCARSPEVSPESFQDADQRRCDQLTLVGGHAFQDIERYVGFDVTGIEIDNVGKAMAWDDVQHTLGKVAVRVNQSESLPPFEMRPNERLEDRGFSRAALSAAVNMLKAIAFANAEWAIGAEEVGGRKECEWIVVLVHGGGAGEAMKPFTPPAASTSGFHSRSCRASRSARDHGALRPGEDTRIKLVSVIPSAPLPSPPAEGVVFSTPCCRR